MIAKIRLNIMRQGICLKNRTIIRDIMKRKNTRFFHLITSKYKFSYAVAIALSEYIYSASSAIWFE